MPGIYINEDEESARIAEEQKKWKSLRPIPMDAELNKQSRGRCSKFERCSVMICPLDLNIASRYMMWGEKICPLIMDYLEGKEVPFLQEIKNTQKIWEKKIRKKQLTERLKSREELRKYHHKTPL